MHTPSPWAMVASRCTWRPSTRLIAAVSASHSWGNSWATWETGQCCWHSCCPTSLDGELAHGRDVALGGEHLGQRLGGRQLGLVGDHVGEPLLDERHPSVGEGPDRLVAAGLGQEPQCLDGEVVVGLVEAVATGVGDREHLGRTATTASGAAGRGSRASTASSATRWSRWRRTAAGVRSSRAASAAAVEGPCSRIDRATRSRVGWPISSPGSNSTTPVCRYCFGWFK